MKPNNTWYKIVEPYFELYLYIQAGSKRNEVVGLHADKLKIKIKANPHDGKANRELINYLSDLCNIPKSSIDIIKGKSSREKIVRIQNEPEPIISLIKKFF